MNYTDPSGHFLKRLVNKVKKTYNTAKRAVTRTYNKAKSFVKKTVRTVKRAATNVWNSTKSFARNTWNNTKSFAKNTWNRSKNFVKNTWNSATSKAEQMYQSSKEYVNKKVTQAAQTVTNAYEKAKQAGQLVYNWGVSKSKEAANIGRNWTKALEETVRHVCESALFANDKVYASTIKSDLEQIIASQGYNAQMGLEGKLFGIRNSDLSEVEKMDAIIKAYEDYLYAMNKEAFDEYWAIRKTYGDKWDPKTEEAKDAEKALSRKLQASGINIREVTNKMGNQILSSTKYQNSLSPSAFIQFKDMVNTGKPMDLKHRSYGEGNDYSIWARGWEKGMSADYLGNYLYGYVGDGMLGIGGESLKYAAGAAQEISDIQGGMSVWDADKKAFESFWNGGYFDNLGDAAMIQDGVDAYNRK